MEDSSGTGAEDAALDELAAVMLSELALTLLSEYAFFLISDKEEAFFFWQ
ncbi:hypothetical protein [Lactiplantibacillus pentosus]|nr:hypothetical protein [Lactiplantibacillus pentosus]